MAVQYRFTDGEFNMPDVLFALSLMILPTLTMGGFFVAAGQFGSEILVATKRIDKFLKTPEPPLKEEKEHHGEERGCINVCHKSYGWYSLEDEKKKKKIPKAPSWRLPSRVPLFPNGCVADPTNNCESR